MPSLSQIGVAGGPELLVALLLLGILVVPALLVSLIVYLDATDRDSRHAIAWALGALLGGVVVWVLYFAVRDEVGPSGSAVNGRP
jgi:RsiW-degrading membrane proteinase PrsW (M82 family)